MQGQQMSDQFELNRGYMLVQGEVSQRPRELSAEEIKLPGIAGPMVFVVGVAFTLFGLGVWTKYTAAGFDWYDALTKAAQLVLLCSGLASVLLVRRQMVAQQKVNLQTREREKKEFQYNRMEAFYKYFGEDCGKETQSNFEKMLDESVLSGHFIGSGKVIEDEVMLSRIVSTHAWDSAIRAYLDRHESLAAAVNSGFIDGEMAYCLQAGRIIRAVKVFRPLIEKYQAGNPKAYCELLELDRAWRADREKRVEEDRKKQEAIRRAAQSGQVTKRFRD